MGQKKPPFAAKAAVSAVFAVCSLASLAAVSVPASATGGAVRALGVPKGISGLSSIACPTTSRCIAVGVGNSREGGDGRTVVVSAATGTSTVWPGKVAYPLESIACAVSTACVGISENSAAHISPTTGAATVTHKFSFTGIVALSDVACAGSSSCYAVGWEGLPSAGKAKALVVHLSPTGQFLGQVSPDGTGSPTISCPTSSHCLFALAASSGEWIEQLNSGALGAKVALPGDLHVQALSCYKDEACYALVFHGGQNGDEVVAVNPTTGKVGAPVALKGFAGDGIDCVSARRCLVPGNENGLARLVTVTNGTPGAPVGYLGSSLSGAACASANVCYVVGTEAAGGVIDRLAS